LLLLLGDSRSFWLDDNAAYHIAKKRNPYPRKTWYLNRLLIVKLLVDQSEQSAQFVEV
jgi:hypothetical protein